jgi:cytochrome c oxidase subunit 3
MNREFEKELSPEVREKTKKNLVYVAIFSIIMLFAGFTSAYVVSMGDSFWLKYPLPVEFWVSTAVIALSSISMILAIRAAKNDQQTKVRLFMSVTLLAGIAFVVFQFRGYKALTSFGAHAVNNHIIVTEGRYGDYFEIKYNGSFIEVDGNDFLLNGKKLSKTQMSNLQEFMNQFLEVDREKKPIVTNYGSYFVLYLDQAPLGLMNGQLTKPNGKTLQYVDMLRLRDLAVNIRDGRGDFFVKGKLGKDFSIYFKGKELQYKNRELLYEGRKLSKYLQIKAMETSDTASSYLYIITFLHLLHVMVTLIYMIKLTKRSFSGEFNSSDTLGIRVGAIFWHFLGLLWLYLLLFLLFIH